MSVLAQVVERTSAGQAPDAVARDLGISRDLVATMVGEAERMGRLDVLRLASCSEGCAPTTACAGCPLARQPRAHRGSMPPGT